MEQDGSGDYETVQPAVDNAASGDTILIGPGRYVETTPFHPGDGKGWPKHAHIGVSVDGLTFIGAGMDEVIIGPEVSDYTPDGPEGIINRATATYLAVENLTIENVYEGMYILGQVVVSNCRIRFCENGIVYWSPDGLLVDSCFFEGNSGGVGIVGGPLSGGNVELSNCEFENNVEGVLNITAFNVVINSCAFNNNHTGVNYGSSGSCVVEG